MWYVNCLRFFGERTDVLQMPLSALMDTPGFLTRDATLWKTAGEVLYSGNLTEFSSFPKTIYTSGFPLNASNEAEGVLLDFLAKLETFLKTHFGVVFLLRFF